MKLPALLAFAFCVACRAQPCCEIAIYSGHVTNLVTTNAQPVCITLYHYGLVSLHVRGGVGFSAMHGTWREIAGSREISIHTATNSYVGTIRNGIVKGTWTNFTATAGGVFVCYPPAPGTVPPCD